MSILPIGLRADNLTVLVIGAGSVGLRKARAFAQAGARVRVVAPEITEDVTDVTAGHEQIEVARREFTDEDIESADLVVAASSDPAVNERVTRVARATRRLVNRVDKPADGTFDTLAVHRSGELVIAVSAGGLPRAAAVIRDEIGQRFDGRYARALDQLRDERANLLAADSRNDWRQRSAELLTENFCSAVEDGIFDTARDDCH